VLSVFRDCEFSSGSVVLISEVLYGFGFCHQDKEPSSFCISVLSKSLLGMCFFRPHRGNLARQQTKPRRQKPRFVLGSIGLSYG